MEIKEQLKKYRKQNKYVQKDIAEKLNMSITGYGSWEQGLSKPNIEQIKTLAKLYNISTDELLGVSDKIIERHSAEIIQHTTEETELLTYFRAVKNLQRIRILGFAQALYGEVK